MPSAVATAAYNIAWYATSTLPASIAQGINYTAYAMGYGAGMAGLSAASQELMERDMPGMGSGEGLGQKLRMSKDPAQPHRVIYGKTRVGADLVFYDVNNGGKDLHMVCVFAGHPCEAIDEVLVEGDTLNLDSNGVAQGKYSKANVEVTKHLGDQTSADSELVNNVKVWTPDHVGNEITYLYFKAQAENREDHRELFSGLPSVSGVVRGKNDIYDPRSGSTGYTNNPALCTRDFITSGRYGYNFSPVQIDTEDVIDSANNCEETVNGQDRYTCNGSFRDDGRKDDVLRNMLSSMAGETVWSQGKQRILSGMWRPTVDTYDEDQLLSGINTETKRSRQDLFNTVRGTYANPSDNYQPTSFPQVQYSQYVNEDDGVVIPKSVELKFTTNEAEAQRIAQIMLKKHRLQKSTSTTFNIEAFNAQAGDNVGMDLPRYSWEPKRFHVGSWDFKLEQGDDNESGLIPMIEMELSERDPSVFQPDSVTETEISSPAVSFR